MPVIGPRSNQWFAITAPFFVAFFGLPVYTVAGAALMGTFANRLANRV